MRIHLWYVLVVSVLTGLLVEHLLTFEPESVLSWFRLALFTGLLILSFFAYPPRVRIGDAYAEQLRRKDKAIKELQERNELLARTAVRQAEKTREISEKARGLLK
jgi:hypothetical protein